MIERLDLTNYKAFKQVQIDLGKTTVLVGPNNAGKSTILEALRCCTAMIRHASLRRAKTTAEWKRETHRVHEFPEDTFGLELANLRHNFSEAESSIRLYLTGGLTATAVWPASSPERAFFFLQEGRRSLETPTEVRRAFPRIGVVPILTPLEKEERLLNESYVVRNATTRLASRHFRNHLYLLEEEGSLSDFLAFCGQHLDDIGIAPPVERDGELLNAFFRERGGQRELYWAGDGLQIFLQLLLHLYRERDAASLILDEPDVYLHPDLQRKLMRLLLEVAPQIVVATHSQEVVMEAGGDSLVWIDKSRKRSITVPDDARLTELSDSVGSAFNLGLARALKARAVLFVEGEEDVLLRDLAAKLDLRSLALGGALATLSLGGVDRLDRLESLAWLADAFLGKSVRGFVLLDGDYRPKDRVEQMIKQVEGYGLQGHVWKRKEIESYLMHPAVIARVSGATQPWVRGVILEATNHFEDLVLTQMMDRFYKERVDRRQDSNNTNRRALRQFKALWKVESDRLSLLPPKDLRHFLNKRLQEGGFRTFRFRQLSREIRPTEIPSEMRKVLSLVNSLAYAASP